MYIVNPCVKINKLFSAGKISNFCKMSKKYSIEKDNNNYIFLRSKYKKCNIYKSIIPVLFDVTLRDGIQNANEIDWTTDRKKDFLHHITLTESPQRIEIGSLVSPKVLPVLRDSLHMYDYSQEIITKHKTDFYMLIPSLTKLDFALNHKIKNLSFITSVSNSFQKKNTRRTLEETKNELNAINNILCQETNVNIRTKLYISCITECPIEGKQDIDYVLNEILHYHTTTKFDELCLSDTCGTLTFDDYEYLLDALLFFGIPVSKISLHLHANKQNIDNLRRILWYSFDKKVNKFDVSMLETGGCSVTMKQDQILPNLSYDLFYEILDRYIQCKV
jgi:hypothetical protein